MPIETSDGPANRYVLVTKANANLGNGLCRGLLVGTPGTANLMEGDGSVRTNVPLIAGYNPLMCLQVQTGGTADNIWALY